MKTALFEGTPMMSMVIPRAVMLVLETFQLEVAKLGGVLKDNLHEDSSWEAT